MGADAISGRFNLANTLTEGHLFSAAIYEFGKVTNFFCI